jgi:FMN phosphatase YigB (HAD superfamily)
VLAVHLSVVYSGDATSTDTLQRIADDAFAHYESGDAWQLVHTDEVTHRTLAQLRTRGLRLAVLSNFDTRLRQVLSDMHLLK